MSGAALFSLLALYFIILFWLANWSVSNTNIANKVRDSGITYSLSLAVFCTSWTYYGNVGQASTQGINHVSLFLGSTLVFIFLSPLLKRMIRIKNHYHSTSIADFISTRYNNSYLIAAFISLFCLVGIIPYISIQFKAVFITVAMLSGSDVASAGSSDLFKWVVVILIIVFTILFGVRKLDPTERHPGMMVALAAEGIFKLFAFLVAAIFICFVLYKSPIDIIESGLNVYANSLSVVSIPSSSAWFTSMLLGAVGMFVLPRQFHVGIVECSNEKLIDSARWQFPLYLLAINLLVIPVAVAGKLYLPAGSSADLVLLAIPINAGYSLIAILVFIGGFAAATGMIMVSAMTLSTMVTNHLVVPLLEYNQRFSFFRHYLLYVRWAVVALIILLSLGFNSIIGDSALLVKIGSISFVAVAQLMPLLLGALLWERANLKGAIAGLLGGALLWVYTMLLPALIDSGWIQSSLLQSGLFSQSWLRPESLLGLHFESSTAHSLFFSLVINSSLFVFVSSICKRHSGPSLDHAREFMRIGQGKIQKKYRAKLATDISLASKYDTLLLLLNKYLSREAAVQKLDRYFAQSKLTKESNVDIIQLTKLCSDVTGLLAGIIGMASASRVINHLVLLTEQERDKLKHCYTQLLADSQVSPDELLEKVDYYQDKQAMLEDHARQQRHIIEQLKTEQALTNSARQALKLLNSELENRVLDRTQELSLANSKISKSLSKLRSMQHQLVQADRMASLGSLVAGVAHEINTPVGTMMTALSKLNEQYIYIEQRFSDQKATKKDLDSFLLQVRTASNIALENVHKTAKLVDSFKQVAVDLRLEDLHVFSLKQLILSTIQELQSQYPQLNFNVEVHCNKTISLNSYPEILSKVFGALLLNSVIHGYRDSLSGTAFINVNQTEQGLNIDYADNGVGLSEEGKEKFFEPFYTTIRGEGGSGLGGHIIYNLITQTLQGDVEIDKNHTQGFKISIRFPLTILG